MPEQDQSIFERSLSNKTGSLEKTVQELKSKYKQLWQETASIFPEFSNSYTRNEKRRIESETTRFLDELAENHEQHSIAQMNRNDIFKEKEQDIVRFCQLAGLYMDKQFSEGFDRSTKVFMEKVKKFDSSLKPENIYQAMRNVWIMNSLQILMNQEMSCSNSMFAYSMLYPYSDNVNDDVSINVEEKLKMNDNFRQWLEGKTPPYRNENEKKIYLLVKMIEEQFPRSHFPAVFQSLLAIFNAQIKSLIQHQNGSGTDILDISLEKGGTSVLADGYLLTGNMDEKQQDFCFGYGAFLQFADDIQDVWVDKKNGHITLFSQLAGVCELDNIANKLLNYISKVIDFHLSDAAVHRLRDLIFNNCNFMVLEAIGKNRHLYSQQYITEIESHFPFTFSYFRTAKGRLKKILLSAEVG
ncbi:MAG: hypothetical protein JSW07_13970 [bacterium]|nr:MAG: hypothetical protein JSW07_13970 [bacterium]